MSATQAWIKEQYEKESKPIITEYSLHKELKELQARVRQLEEDMAYKVKEG